MTNDEAYDLIIAVASGDLDDVGSIAKELGRHVAPRAIQRRRN
jgi:hypothetical protein